MIEEILNNSVRWMDMIYFVTILLFLTSLQKYHYKILHQLKKQLGKFGSLVVDILIRISVIIHEFSHLIFVAIFGGKVKSIKLFSRSGGQVNFSMPDYLGNMMYYDMSFRYLLGLIKSRIGICFVSVAPILIGGAISMGVLYLGFDIRFWEAGFQTIQKTSFQVAWRKLVLLLVYCLVVLPGFLLSFKDISNLFWYRSKSLLASIFGSFLNMFFTLGFVYLFSLFLGPLIYLASFYVLSFVIILAIWLFFQIVGMIKKLV